MLQVSRYENEWNQQPCRLQMIATSQAELCRSVQLFRSPGRVSLRVTSTLIWCDLIYICQCLYIIFLIRKLTRMRLSVAAMFPIVHEVSEQPYFVCRSAWLSWDPQGDDPRLDGSKMLGSVVYIRSSLGWPLLSWDAEGARLPMLALWCSSCMLYTCRHTQHVDNTIIILIQSMLFECH